MGTTLLASLEDDGKVQGSVNGFKFLWRWPSPHTIWKEREILHPKNHPSYNLLYTFHLPDNLLKRVFEYCFMSEESGTQSSLSRTTVLEFKSRSLLLALGITLIPPHLPDMLERKPSLLFSLPSSLGCLWLRQEPIVTPILWMALSWLVHVTSDNHMALQEQRGRSAYPSDLGHL